MYTIVAAHDATGEEFDLTRRYLRWQGLLTDTRTETLSTILREAHGLLLPTQAFYVQDPDGNKLFGFHKVVQDVQIRGLQRLV